jgi:cytoskeletal protein CcmA (bactofilin family)
MFSKNTQPVDKETEMTRPSAAPPNVNPDMVSQLNKVARHAEDIQKQEEAESKTDNQHRKLTVGPGIRLKGEITDCDTLVVEGHVELSAKSRLIEIAETGTVIGDIEVKTADVSGRFDGSLNVNERLTIRSTGRVSGKIRYNTIEIESGGRISGNVETEEEAKDRSPVVKDVNKPDRMAS